MNGYHQGLEERSVILTGIFDKLVGRLIIEKRISLLESLTTNGNSLLTLKSFYPIKRRCDKYISHRSINGFLTEKEKELFKKRLTTIAKKLKNQKRKSLN